MQAVDRCARCGALWSLVGKQHRCIAPLQPHHYVPSAAHQGDCAVCGHLQLDAIHEVDDGARPQGPPRAGTAVVEAPARLEAPVLAPAPGGRAPRPTPADGPTMSYARWGIADVPRRRAYMRDYMRKRRART